MFNLTKLLFCLLLGWAVVSCSDGCLPHSRPDTASVQLSASASQGGMEGSASEVALSVFRQTPDRKIEMLDISPLDWIFTGEKYVADISLEVGEYHFLLSKGMEILPAASGNAGEFCYMEQDACRGVHSGLSDYTVHHPANENGLLKECGELYLNFDGGIYTGFAGLVNLSNISDADGLKLTSKLTHAQGRADLLFVCSDTGGNPIEGAPLEYVSSVEISFSGLSATYHIGADAPSTGTAAADFVLNPADFTPIDASYLGGLAGLSDTQNGTLAGYADNGAVVKSWCFFPSGNVSGRFTVNFKNGHTVSKDFTVAIERNKVTLAVVRMVSSYLVFDIDVENFDNVEWGSSEGDDGFWGGNGD